MHSSCRRKLRVTYCNDSGKWILDSNHENHSSTLREVLCRQDGSSIKGIKGSARSEIERLVASGCKGPATIENEMNELKRKDPNFLFNIPSRDKIKYLLVH